MRTLTLKLLVSASLVACLRIAAAADLPARNKPNPAAGAAGKDCTSSGCHDRFGKRAVVHAPVSSGSCEACHEEVDRKGHKFKLTAGEPELCTGCHDEVGEGLKYEHGPVAAGSCTVCHPPHASDHEGLLVAAGPDLCLPCHSDLKDRLAAGPSRHDPAAEDCTACHRPHGAGDKMFLKARIPELCTECHDAIADILEDATVKHGAMTEKNACVLCHDPHAAAQEHLLRQDPMALCLSCHQKALKSGKGEVLGIGALLKSNPNHHGPIRQNNCTACHSAVHGGDRFRLLIADYPARFYAPFDVKRYALCFACHEPDLVEEARTVTATGFRNGDRNLHYLHVNRKVKGRTCRACHETHASKLPRHIRESVPFGPGGWRLPIHFEESKTGGSCQPGCHRKYGYDREKAVVNIPQGSGAAGGGAGPQPGAPPRG